VEAREVDTTSHRRGFLSFLTEDDVERIHEGGLYILARTGILVHDEPVLSLLEQVGCPVSREDRRVRIPAPVVEEAVARAPRLVHLYNRLGQEAMALGAGSLHARTSSGATGILDLETGRRRLPTSQDAANVARLADALPHMQGVSTMAAQPADVPVPAVDVHAVRIALSNTVKPLGYLCLNVSLIEPVLDMLALVVGGDEILRERPIATALVESTSPLRFVSSQMSVLRAFARRGLPLTLHAHPMAGLTAPVTLCGELVVTHAEILALVTIAQLIRPGTPVVYGMSSSVPDMRSGANLSGAVEIGLLGAAVAQLARRCGLPCLVSSGTDAHSPGAQSTMERLMTLWLPALAGIDLVNLTTLDTKMSFSLEQLVIDDTILGLVARCQRGIAVDDRSLALDLIHQVGPGGAFIAADHTLRHFRDELSVPDLIDRRSRKAWEASGAPDMCERAREKARHTLAEHRPLPLADDVVTQLDEIVRKAEAGQEL
jgi:trimethylamine--corrinoid protein Co-methyltransferase